VYPGRSLQQRRRIYGPNKRQNRQPFPVTKGEKVPFSQHRKIKFKKIEKNELAALRGEAELPAVRPAVESQRVLTKSCGARRRGPPPHRSVGHLAAPNYKCP